VETAYTSGRWNYQNGAVAACRDRLKRLDAW
jgi:hypothetical protein